VEQTLAHTLGVWIAALLTFCAFSFLYKDNPFYKFAEALFVGVSTGYGAASVFHFTFRQDLWIPLSTALGVVHEDPTAWWVVAHRAIPCLLGLLMLSRFIPKYGWLSRIPLAFIIGYSAGIAVTFVVTVSILPQMQTSVSPLIVQDPQYHVMWIQTAWRFLLIFGMLSVLGYFFFSKEHKGAYGKFTRFGVYFMMIGFGASFGNTVMARMSLLIGRIQFLIEDLLGTFGMHVGS
jgi:hypothetical protein